MTAEGADGPVAGPSFPDGIQLIEMPRPMAVLPGRVWTRPARFSTPGSIRLKPRGGLLRPTCAVDCGETSDTGGRMTARGYRAKAAALMGAPLAALALTASCASPGSRATTTRTDTNPTTASTQATAVLSSTTLTGLTRLAKQAAAAQDAGVRSAVAVRTTRRAANLALGGDIVGTDPGEVVWAIAVVTKAPVVCRTCSYPPGAKPPQGTVITLVADATSLNIMDNGLSDKAPNLATLGTPVPLPV